MHLVDLDSTKDSIMGPPASRNCCTVTLKVWIDFIVPGRICKIISFKFPGPARETFQTLRLISSNLESLCLIQKNLQSFEMSMVGIGKMMMTF